MPLSIKVRMIGVIRTRKARANSPTSSQSAEVAATGEGAPGVSVRVVGSPVHHVQLWPRHASRVADTLALGDDWRPGGGWGRCLDRRRQGQMVSSIDYGIVVLATYCSEGCLSVS